MRLPPLREKGDVGEQVDRGLEDIERVIAAKILRLSFCRRSRDNICNRNQPRYIRAIDSVHALPYQIPIISFTSRSAIFTAPTRMSMLKISSPM